MISNHFWKNLGYETRISRIDMNRKGFAERLGGASGQKTDVFGEAGVLVACKIAAAVDGRTSASAKAMA
jgi:hypothetical protein